MLLEDADGVGGGQGPGDQGGLEQEAHGALGVGVEAEGVDVAGELGDVAGEDDDEEPGDHHADRCRSATAEDQRGAERVADIDLERGQLVLARGLERAQQRGDRVVVRAEPVLAQPDSRERGSGAGQVALSWLAGIVGAVLFGLLAYFSYQLAVIIGMAAIGFTLGTSVMTMVSSASSFLTLTVGVIAPGMSAARRLMRHRAGAPTALGRVLAGAQGKCGPAPVRRLHAHRGHRRAIRQAGGARQVRHHAQGRRLERLVSGQGLAPRLAGCQGRAELQVVVDVVYPHIEDFVGDDEARVEQIEEGRRRHASQLLAQAPVRRQLIVRHEQALQIHVTRQRQHAAIVAIHTGQAPEQRQIGRHDLLLLAGHDQIVQRGRVQLSGEQVRQVGLIAGVVCSQAVSLKRRFGYDDSLDVVGVHFVGGLVGSLLIGLLSNPGATGWEEGRGPGLAQPGLLFGGGLGLLGEQVLANAVTIVFSGVMTAGILYALSVTIGLRVDDETEVEGLDRAQHAETAYHQAGLAVGTRS